LKEVRDRYDYILLDPGPNLSSLTINALYAADYIIIPTELEMLSIKGLQLLLQRVDDARRHFNPRLQVAGAVAMKVQSRTNASRVMDQALREGLGRRGIRAFHSSIKHSTRYSEVSISRHAMVAAHPQSEHAVAYKRLLAELLQVVGGPAQGLLTSEQLDDIPDGRGGGSGKGDTGDTGDTGRSAIGDLSNTASIEAENGAGHESRRGARSALRDQALNSVNSQTTGKVPGRKEKVVSASEGSGGSGDGGRSHTMAVQQSAETEKAGNSEPPRAVSGRGNGRAS
jgi:hypothetical protein